TWVGTCRNPANGKDYLISYNDCCGATMCGQCFCNKNERERPAYRMGVHNDINWCMSNASNTYHCTVAAIVGVGDPKG
ncbi:MAG: methylamine dehydrogenase light chain, partial [Burkholderiaceae bacterium]